MSPHPSPTREMRLAQAAKHSDLAAHYEGESHKLRAKIEARMGRITGQAERDLRSRRQYDIDIDATARIRAQGDTYISEYSAGLVIVERRAAMHAALATDMRIQIMLELQLALLPSAD